MANHSTEKTTLSSQALSPSTTFVHADPKTFKEVVQRLTGPFDDDRRAPATAVPLPGSPNNQSRLSAKAAGFKRPPASTLKERRQQPQPQPLQCSLTIRKPRSPAGYSGSPLPSPSTILSGLSILEGEEEGCCCPLELNREEEERAIKERRFYLHPSPRSARPRSAEPELLPLFPVSLPGGKKC